MRTAKNTRGIPMWIALSLAGLLALSSCSAGDSADSGADWDAASDDAGAPADAEEPSGGDAGDDGGQNAGEGGQDGGGAELPPADLGDSTGPDGDADRSEENIAAAGRSVITEATVGIVVDDPQRVMQRITAAVSSMGGWVEGVTYRAATEDEGGYASILVRIPSGEVGGALEHLAVYGTIQSTDLSRVDVTTHVRDLDARIAAMEMSVQRMAVFLDQATTRTELLEAEQMYTDRQAQLESLLSQKRSISGQVSMSTITVELWTPESAPEPEPEPEPEVTGFWAGLTRGWNAFYDFGSDALLVIGTLLPWLLFLFVVLALVLVARRPVGEWLAARAARRPARPAPPMGRPQGQPYATAPMPGAGQPPAGPPPGGPPQPPAGPPAAGPEQPQAGPPPAGKAQPPKPPS